jgi:hypothetical protein
MYHEQFYRKKYRNQYFYKTTQLDIDDRAMQLARFAVLLKAARVLPDTKCFR